MACSRLVLAQGTYTQIDYPGAEDTICYGINAAGDISGSYASVDGRWHGFLLSGGVYTTIDYPGSTGTYVNGLNDFGQIVGQTNSDPFVGFSYNIASQTFTQISYPGSSTTSPLSISNSGVIVGFTGVNQTVWAFELDRSNHRLIAPPGAQSTYVYGISSSGKLVGYFSEAIWNPVGFSFAHGKYRRTRLPGAPDAIALGISPSGNRFVGYYYPDSQTTAAFLYQNKTLQTLQFPQSNSTTAVGVNDAGEVVGSFLESGGFPQHGFSWTPPGDAVKR